MLGHFVADICSSMMAVADGGLVLLKGSLMEIFTLLD
jgi:hypothetical protein